MQRLLGFTLLAFCCATWADGGFMPSMTARVAGVSGAASTEQKGIIIQEPKGREVLLLQTTYHGPAAEFAWVIPVPGKPRKSDVFLASTDFIDQVLDHTQPSVVTNINDMGRAHRHDTATDGMMMGGVEGGPGMGGPAGGEAPQQVVVHDRMDVGDYEAAVLSATGTEVLIDWLREHDFRVPPDSADVFGHYVTQHWYFVALKMQPAKADETPVLDDVAPIGLRFPAERLTYPLYISRVSSRQKTGLTVVMIAHEPVKCDQLTEVDLPLERRLARGACYARVRREAVQGKARCAVCEYRDVRGMPYSDIGYRKDEWLLEGPQQPPVPLSMIGNTLVLLIGC